MAETGSLPGDGFVRGADARHVDRTGSAPGYSGALERSYGAPQDGRRPAGFAIRARGAPQLEAICDGRFHRARTDLWAPVRSQSAGIALDAARTAGRRKDRY